MRRTLPSLLLFFVSAWPSVSTAAAIVPTYTVYPTGLPAGEKYRIMFVTSVTHDALSANIEDYNDFVTSVANSVPELAAMGTTWKAVVSTPSIDARDNTDTNPNTSLGVPIFPVHIGGVGYDGFNYLTDRIASNNVDLWSRHLMNPPQVSELGTLLQTNVLTGTNSDGIGLQPIGIIGGNPTAAVGHGHSYNRVDWAFDDWSNATDTRSFYAISGIVPEPSTIVLAAICMLGLALTWLRRRGTVHLIACHRGG